MFTRTVIATMKYEFTTTNSLQRAIPCNYRKFFSGLLTMCANLWSVQVEG